MPAGDKNLHQTDREDSNPSQNDLLALNRLRVLVVDADSDTRELLTFVLEAEGAEVATATSVCEALAVMKALEPDVLTSEVVLPGEDGYSLIRKVRALDAETGNSTRAIAVTAFATEETYPDLLAAGFEKCLPKPTNLDEFIAVILTLVEQNACGERDRSRSCDRSLDNPCLNSE